MTRILTPILVSVGLTGSVTWAAAYKCKIMDSSGRVLKSFELPASGAAKLHLVADSVIWFVQREPFPGRPDLISVISGPADRSKAGVLGGLDQLNLQKFDEGYPVQTPPQHHGQNLHCDAVASVPVMMGHDLESDTRDRNTRARYGLPGNVFDRENGQAVNAR